MHCLIAGVHGPGQPERLAAGARCSRSVQVKYSVGRHRNVAFSGSRIQSHKDNGSQIPDPDPRHCCHRNVASSFSASNLVFSTVLCFNLYLYSDSLTIYFFLVVILFWFTLLTYLHSTVVKNLPATGAGVPYFYQTVSLQKSTHFGHEKFLSLWVTEV